MSAAENLDPPVRYELSGDQYELFPLPPGPSRVFRALLGQSDPPPELMAEPPAIEDQYEIFPELGLALKGKPEPPPGMVDDTELSKLQDVLEPGADKLASILSFEDDPDFADEPEPAPRVMPNFGDTGE